MATGALISVAEYLSSSYTPDVDFVEGELLERNVGEKDHSRVQGLLTAFLIGLEQKLGIWVYPEQRLQIAPTRYRVPDICVVAGPEPREQVFTQPPFLCVEVLSPEDRMSRMEEKIQDYLEFGVPYVWVLDPRSQKAWIYSSDSRMEVKDGLLKTRDPVITAPLDRLFGR
ncbi:MAG: Uma2 family endonuclease [Bryobacteraceae bacterium]|nr:Uma2 family endonuclease [Bryobacteraceae bacterium]